MFKSLDLRQKFSLTAIASIIGIAIYGIYWFYSDNPDAPRVYQGADSIAAPAGENVPVVVDVAGAVKSPNVYQLPSGSRVQDAIEAAGGSLENADLSQLNLAALLFANSRLTIPRHDETLDHGRYGASYAVQSESKPVVNFGSISINSGTPQELDLLPGIGPKKAGDIIAYRNRIGGFKTLEELKGVRGIGDKTFAKLRPYIRL